MSRMICGQCGVEEEERSMTVCRRCGMSVCPRCTAAEANGYCVSCQAEMNTIQDIL